MRQFLILVVLVDLPNLQRSRCLCPSPRSPTENTKVNTTKMEGRACHARPWSFRVFVVLLFILIFIWNCELNTGVQTKGCGIRIREVEEEIRVTLRIMQFYGAFPDSIKVRGSIYEVN